MEVEEIQTQGSKFPRIGINNSSARGGGGGVGCNFPNPEGPNNEEEETKRASLAISTDFGPGRFCGWPASRIVRVSRASGGKDRHSKVWTSKGLRDRRVRLSVHTAIQFYDLQDRLGYDQPSKAVEWLLKAAASSIDELPSINTSFPPPDTPTGVSGEVEIGSESTHPVSSNSETSKGSGGGGPLSGSRSESLVKARERAKERKAEREKEKESAATTHHNHHRHLLPQNSFTELLTGDGQRQWGSAAATATVPQMDYFSMGQYHNQIQHQEQQHHHQQQQQLQQFSLLQDHMTAADLSFTMSSSSSSGNMNRGTLQSNSPHSLLLPHHHHHYGSAVPFFIGTAAAPTTADHHHHHNNNQFPAGLQLCYGDENGRHLDHKGKGKN